GRAGRDVVLASYTPLAMARRFVAAIVDGVSRASRSASGAAAPGHDRARPDAGATGGEPGASAQVRSEVTDAPPPLLELVGVTKRYAEVALAHDGRGGRRAPRVRGTSGGADARGPQGASDPS